MKKIFVICVLCLLSSCASGDFIYKKSKCACKELTNYADMNA